MCQSLAGDAIVFLAARPTHLALGSYAAGDLRLARDGNIREFPSSWPRARSPRVAKRPPRRVRKWRRLRSSMGSSPEPAVPAYSRLRMLWKRPKVLGIGLNRPESSGRPTASVYRASQRPRDDGGLRSSRTARGAQVLPPAGATVPPWLRESSSRVSSLLACYALGPPTAQYSCHRGPSAGLACPLGSSTAAGSSGFGQAAYEEVASRWFALFATKFCATRSRCAEARY